MFDIKEFNSVISNNKELKEYIFKILYRFDYLEYIYLMERQLSESNDKILFNKCIDSLDYSDYGNIGDFPVLNKNDIRVLKNLGKINKFRKKRFNTGGSTGSPFEFYLSKLSGINEYYHQKFMYQKYGYRSGDIIASFDGTKPRNRDLRKNHFYLTKKITGFPYGHIKYSSHYFSKETELHYIDSICRIKPKFIRGYPSFITEISKSIIKHNVKVNSVKAIFMTSETILPQQLEVIEEAFNVKVFGQYGNSEATVFAVSETGYTNYICSPIYGHVEVLNEQMKHVEIGDIGEIVTTSYFTRHTPFIRYRTGDMAEYGGVQDGCVVLKRIYGRTGDFVLDGLRNKVNITGLIFGQHFKCFKLIKEWQIVQDTIGIISVNIVPMNNESHSDFSEIREKIVAHVSLVVDINIVDSIKKTISGKTSFVINNLRFTEL